jgi:hypothetical protein
MTSGGQVMVLGDGFRRNIASVEPAERALLRDALLELNRRLFPGTRNDPLPGGVSWWFKQDEIHQATHVHGGPEFLPWHREIVNRLEEMLRQINPQLSLHYWDWTQDPRSISDANLGSGQTGTLNLFTSGFMGYGGSTPAPIGEPWLGAGYYVPGATTHRDITSNPADPPREVIRSVSGSPASAAEDSSVVAQEDYADMRAKLEVIHDHMHGFVNMGGPHISFRDPFVFLLHSNVDRLFARWQNDPAHPERLVGRTVYGSESNKDVLVRGVIQNVNHDIQPWSGGTFTRPWAPPENEQVPKNYKHPSVVSPPRYFVSAPIWRVSWGGTSRWEEINTSQHGLPSLAFGDFNGDGKTDVFRAQGGAWFVSWGGTSRWEEINTSQHGLPSLAFGDFNGDGKTDVFSTGRRT